MTDLQKYPEPDWAVYPNVLGKRLHREGYLNPALSCAPHAAGSFSLSSCCIRWFLNPGRLVPNRVHHWGNRMCLFQGAHKWTLLHTAHADAELAVPHPQTL